MNIGESQAWRPGLNGTSWDILPYYRDLAPRLPKSAICAEIGVAWGRSTIFLASELVALGNLTARVYAIDPWEWAPFSGASALTLWAPHASKAELALVCPVRTSGERAARLFDPRSLDLVFVDGDHSYEGCAADIRAFLPLVKPGGVLAGHDFGDFEARTFGGPTYPGVDRAVRELIGEGRFTIRDSVWEHVVP